MKYISKTIIVQCVPYRRPSDKKPPEPTKPKTTISETADAKTELLKAPKKPVAVDDKPSEPTAKTIATTNTATSNSPSSLGKIVDMPLITSTNMMSVMRDDESQKTATTAAADQKRATSIARTPAIKKPENEKPRIVAQQSTDATRNHKNTEMSNGVELNLRPIGTSDVPVTETSSFGKVLFTLRSNPQNLLSKNYRQKCSPIIYLVVSL